MTVGIMKVMTKPEHFQLQRCLLKESISSKAFINKIAPGNLICRINKLGPSPEVHIMPLSFQVLMEKRKTLIGLTWCRCLYLSQSATGQGEMLSFHRDHIFWVGRNRFQGKRESAGKTTTGPPTDLYAVFPIFKNGGGKEGRVDIFCTTSCVIAGSRLGGLALGRQWQKMVFLVET